MKTSFHKKFLTYAMMAVLAITSLGLTGCDEDKIVVEKYSVPVQQAVYATGDALSVGDIPKATFYVNELEELIPAPLKNRIQISPIVDKNGIGYVLLGDNLKGKTVVIVGSDQFKQLVKDHVVVEGLAKQEQQFQNQIDAQKKIDDQAINALVVENQKLHTQIANDDKEIAEYHASLEYRIKAWIHGFWLFTLFGVPSALIIGGVLCFFFPALIPIFGEVLGSVFGIVARILGSIFSGLLSWVTWLTTPKS